jgi:hypothetical protein
LVKRILLNKHNFGDPMSIKSAFNVCKEFAKDTFEHVKHPVKSTKDHCGRFWNDMSRKEKALTTLKVIVVGSIGAAIGAAFGLITPALTFVAVPLAAAGAVVGGIITFAYLTRHVEKEEKKVVLEKKVEKEEESAPKMENELGEALKKQKAKLDAQEKVA